MFIGVQNLQALYFRSCDHLVVDDLEVKDSMQMHVVIASCWKAAVSRLFVTAPGWSPNTDGIHVSNSREVSITNCIISTGTLQYTYICMKTSSDSFIQSYHAIDFGELWLVTVFFLLFL